MTYLRLTLVGLLVAAIVGGAFWVGHMRRELVKAREDTAIAQAGRAASDARGKVASDVTAITDAAATRDQSVIIIREQNREAIRTAPGSDEPLDPALVRAGRVGLCRRASYADAPECVALRPVHPAIVPPAGSAGPPATP